MSGVPVISVKYKCLVNSFVSFVSIQEANEQLSAMLRHKPVRMSVRLLLINKIAFSVDMYNLTLKKFQLERHSNPAIPVQHSHNQTKLPRQLEADNLLRIRVRAVAGEHK